MRRISSAPTVAKPGVSTRAVTTTPRNNTVSIPMTDTGTGGSRSAKNAAQTAANTTTSRGTSAAGTTASGSSYAGSYIQRGQNTYVSSASASVMSPTSGAYYCDAAESGRTWSASDRVGKGIENLLTGTVFATVGIAAVLAVASIAAAPVVALLAAGAATMAVTYGTSEIAEGINELILAAQGNTTAQAYNPLRDSLFRGNQGAYDLYGDIGLAGSMGFIALAPLLDTSSRPTPSTATAAETNAGSTAAEGRSGSIKYGELDSLGRTTGVEANITPDMIGTGSPAQSSIRPAGFGGQVQGHARGHLLGNQLGGSGSDPRNLMTIYQNPVNHPVMSSVEASVRKTVEGGQIVNYNVTPIYDGNSLIPRGRTIQATGENGFYIYQTILNRK